VVRGRKQVVEAHGRGHHGRQAVEEVEQRGAVGDEGLGEVLHDPRLDDVQRVVRLVVQIASDL
jgi:hypothetical protein